jgi:hypothetical protein
MRNVAGKTVAVPEQKYKCLPEEWLSGRPPGARKEVARGEIRHRKHPEMFLAEKRRSCAANKVSGVPASELGQEGCRGENRSANEICR